MEDVTATFGGSENDPFTTGTMTGGADADADAGAVAEDGVVAADDVDEDAGDAGEDGEDEDEDGEDEDGEDEDGEDEDAGEDGEDIEDDDDDDDDVEDIEDEGDEDDGEDGEDDEDGDGDGDGEGTSGNAGNRKKTGAKRTGKKAAEQVQDIVMDYGIDSDEEDDVEMEKFEADMREEYLLNFHPESVAVNFDEVRSLCTVVRDNDGDIIDPFHTTIPYLTKYEKARILGLRSKQLNGNIKPMVDVPEYVIDSYRIAEMELEKKAIPFIIRRPLPDGRSEYWRLSDLMFVS